MRAKDNSFTGRMWPTGREFDTCEKVKQLVCDYFLKDLGEEGEVRDRFVVGQQLCIKSGLLQERFNYSYFANRPCTTLLQRHIDII